MDLVAAENKIIVTMEHTARGVHKILEQCTLPLTGKNCVDKLITDMAVFEWKNREKMCLVEVAKGVSLDDVKNATGCKFEVKEPLKEFD